MTIEELPLAVVAFGVGESPDSWSQHVTKQPSARLVMVIDGTGATPRQFLVIRCQCLAVDVHRVHEGSVYVASHEPPFNVMYSPKSRHVCDYGELLTIRNGKMTFKKKS